MTDAPSRKEIELLQRLEEVNRDLMDCDADKAERMAEFREEKKELEDRRNKVLADLDDLRNGVQELPFEEEPED